MVFPARRRPSAASLASAKPSRLWWEYSLIPAAAMACWYSRTKGKDGLDGKGMTCVMATPVPAAPKALMLAAVPNTDRPYMVRPRRRWLMPLMVSMAGLPASPSNTASAALAAVLSATPATSDASFSTRRHQHGLESAFFHGRGGCGHELFAKGIVLVQPLRFVGCPRWPNAPPTAQLRHRNWRAG